MPAEVEARVEGAVRLAFLVDDDESLRSGALVAGLAVAGVGLRRREGGGEAALLKVAGELEYAGKAVVGDFRADAVGDVQKHSYVLGAKAVVAAALKQDAVAMPAAQLIKLITDAALAGVADAGAALGDDQAADLDRRMGHGRWLPSPAMLFAASASGCSCS